MSLLRSRVTVTVEGLSVKERGTISPVGEAVQAAFHATFAVFTSHCMRGRQGWRGVATLTFLSFVSGSTVTYVNISPLRSPLRSSWALASMAVCRGGGISPGSCLFSCTVAISAGSSTVSQAHFGTFTVFSLRSLIEEIWVEGMPISAANGQVTGIGKSLALWESLCGITVFTKPTDGSIDKEEILSQLVSLDRVAIQKGLLYSVFIVVVMSCLSVCLVL